MLKRLAFFVYGTVAYVVFLVTFLYAIAFVGGFGVAARLDGAPRGSLGVSLAIDLLLLAVFAVQHSVMARPWFKRWWTQFVPVAIERSTYVLFASLALILMFWQWRPLGGIVWSVDNAAARMALWTLFGCGWALVLIVTFLINHFDLFGLRQVTLMLVGKPYTKLIFTTPGPYRVIRHPLYFGFLLAFWMTPTMTLAHLVFAVATTAYIVLAIQFEEHDLVAEHGASYEAYRHDVPMLIPGRPSRSTTRSARQAATGAILLFGLASITGHAQDWRGIPAPQVPAGLEVSTDFVPFLIAHAVGTQNYVCLPSGSGVAWRLVGPQATLFHGVGDDRRLQVATHFLSANPDEAGIARPTWQHSIDSSRVWARAVQPSSDPNFVEPGAIPWLLLDVAGEDRGPLGLGILSRAKHIQRINTSGGLAPATGCSQASSIGAIVLVPYEADYVFYKPR